MNKIIEVITPKIAKEVSNQILFNIEQQRKERRSIAISVLHGEVQSGKTGATKGICNAYINEYNSTPLITLTYPHVHLWSQLESDYAGISITKKLYELVALIENEPIKFDNLIKTCNLIIIEEAEYGNGQDGMLKKLLTALDSANNSKSNFNCHIVLIGATNYTIVYSELFDGISIKTTHIKLPVGPNYFGPREILEAGNIIDIGDPKNGEFAINDGKFTKSFWKTFENSFKGFTKGLAILKVKLRSEDDNTSISLCDNVIEYINKKYPEFETFDAYGVARNKENYIMQQINEAQAIARTKKVVLVMVDGLGAGIRLSQHLKSLDLIRFGYDTSSVGSTAAQSLVGRFSGYYIDENGNSFDPTFTLIVDESAIKVYQYHHDMIDNGELSISALSDYNKISTAITQTVKTRSWEPISFEKIGNIKEFGLNVDNKPTNKDIAKVTGENVNTIAEWRHDENNPRSINKFYKKWDNAINGKKQSEINMIDVAYTYYMTNADELESIYIINNKGEYIKYHYIGTNGVQEIETKRIATNKSLYKEIA
jgi:hypothetical protein